MGSDETHFNVSLIMRDKVTARLCPQTTTFLKKKDSRSGIETRPFCFRPAHKPSCRPPLVVPPDNSGKGAGLWMGLFPLPRLLFFSHPKAKTINNNTFSSRDRPQFSEDCYTFKSSALTATEAATKGGNSPRQSSRLRSDCTILV